MIVSSWLTHKCCTSLPASSKTMHLTPFNTFCGKVQSSISLIEITKSNKDVIITTPQKDDLRIENGSWK